VPDLAAGPPEVSADGRTVTVRIRPGVRFSPPVSREVTADDVRYAIERGFFRTVGNAYAPLYFGEIAGARPGVRAGTRISGLETPDPSTLVIRLRSPRGGSLAAALVMQLTAPVPREYAAPFDAARRSRYEANQVATGPYRLADRRPGRRISLVRNPNWDPATDRRPARLDAIDVRIGFEDAVRASRLVLRGRGVVSGDFTPPPPILRSELPERREQFSATSAGGLFFLAMNTTLRPFRSVEVRRAVVAGFDRLAMRRALGGDVTGEQLATHFIPPGVPGFAEAGGRRGTGSRLYAAPRGNPRLARRLLREAGVRPGRHVLRMVSGTDSFSRSVTRVIRRSLVRIGFRVQVRETTPERAFGRCATPSARLHVCANGWFRDYADAQTVIEPLFSGASIRPGGNTNLSQLDDPAIDRAIAAANRLVDPAARARAWAAIDRRLVELAPMVAVTWSTITVMRSADVVAVQDRLLGGWDLSSMALR
jgi:peptide/nickel transport system substrate-binding protein